MTFNKTNATMHINSILSSELDVESDLTQLRVVSSLEQLYCELPESPVMHEPALQGLTCMFRFRSRQRPNQVSCTIHLSTVGSQLVLEMLWNDSTS